MLLIRHGSSQLNIRVLQRRCIVCIFIFGRFGMRLVFEKISRSHVNNKILLAD